MEEKLSQWLYDPVVGKLVAAVIGIAVVYALVRFSQRSVNKYVRDPDTRYRARKFVAFVGYMGGFFVLINVFSDRLTGLTVTLGVAGAGIAFALQEVIASVAGWVAISFGGFYRTGDRVQLGGIKGDVIDVGVLRTTMMELGDWVQGDLYNGRIVRIANSFVFKEPVFNYSADFPFLWDEITFPIKYGSNWKHARDVMGRVADEVVGEYARRSKDAWKGVVKKYLIEDAQVEPLVTIRADENWVELTIRYIVDYKKRRLTKDLLFSRILEEVDQSEGRIRIATSSMELSASPSLGVRLVAPDGTDSESSISVS